ncbi:MAG: cation diffusion facilitator family transporter [Verrucomicrobiota bacterium]
MPLTRLQRSLRATFAGMAVNVVLSGTKLAAGIAGHSHALVADAVESFADIFSSLIVWRGVVVAAVPADEDHPYGHGKAEPIASAIVATMLLGAALWIAITAFGEITKPHPSPAPFTLIVLLLVVAVKEGLFRFVSREGKAVDSSAVRTDAWHHRSDAITSVAAGIGISVALIGGRGFEAAEQIRQVATTTPGVDSVEKCIVRKVGYQYFVDMHVEVDPQMTVLRSHEIAHAVKDKIRDALPAVCDVLVHIEPRKHSPKI